MKLCNFLTALDHLVVTSAYQNSKECFNYETFTLDLGDNLRVWFSKETNEIYEIQFDIKTNRKIGDEDIWLIYVWVLPKFLEYYQEQEVRYNFPTEEREYIEDLNHMITKILEETKNATE